MSASPFIIDHPSPPLPSPTKHYSPLSLNSIEAFPDIPSSPTSKSSPTSTHRSRLEVLSAQSQRPNRPFRTPSQRLPPTALLPASRNASHIDVTSPVADQNRDRDEQPHQRLPRALPAPSLSGPPIRPSTSSIATGLPRASTTAVARQQANAEELKSESLWADMQRTLADVELSAMKSSHLFNAPHSQALEKLRETQLALAQAWARSEADEVVGQDSEDEYLVSDAEGATPAFKSRGKDAPQTKDAKAKTGSERKNRQGSGSSAIGKDLEEETERDIRMARKRREANDHYFKQVNHGVLDVVSRLDEVAEAMKMVERESRAVWEEMEGGGSVTASATDPEGDTDRDERSGLLSIKQRPRGGTTTTGINTGSGTEMSDSPIVPKKAFTKNDKPLNQRNASKGGDR